MSLRDVICFEWRLRSKKNCEKSIKYIMTYPWNMGNKGNPNIIWVLIVRSHVENILFQGFLIPVRKSAGHVAFTVYKCTLETNVLNNIYFLVQSFSLGTYDLRTYWKGLKVKVENQTKIANYENKQKSKTPSLISPWLGGRKGKMSETRSLLQFNIK